MKISKLVLIRRIAGEILDDIKGRKGFDDTWDSLDRDIQIEIRDRFEELVEEELTIAGIEDEGI